MSNPWDHNPQTQPTPEYQQYPPQYSQAQPKRGGAMVGVLIAVVAVLAIAAVSLLGWLLYTSGVFGSSTSSAPAGGTVVVQSTVVETQEPQPEPEEETTTHRTTTTRTTTATTQREAPESSVPGLRADGWDDNTITRCGGGESLVYAGRGDNAWITICDGAGGLTYRSWVFDGHLNEPATQTNPGRFVVDVTPNRIVVDYDVVDIYTNGTLANSVPLYDVATR
ncbi:MAG: hypothetical protein Q4G50_06590 [Corynebacterium sp.]|uniref:hypothetical protein n=1 Tax=Corynebacterium sp. TaxID=1720 RepID=UPI0026DFB1BC|nr:hypothetical protein [Corynebacterium sp.]MDO5669653.1 hypothetical protein [Corynebacterium sp.]